MITNIYEYNAITSILTISNGMIGVYVPFVEYSFFTKIYEVTLSIAYRLCMHPSKKLIRVSIVRYFFRICTGSSLCWPLETQKPPKRIQPDRIGTIFEILFSTETKIFMRKIDMRSRLHHNYIYKL